mmetsp:Transcript_17479/g.30367  ORF Transcript_17479/g.30367 Transcript_17479/m.30367 type:complete len:347 (-) Transcript_17479:164-1204(-)
MVPISLAMIVLYLAFFAMGGQGRRILSPPRQAPAEANTAFVPSGPNLRTAPTRRQSAVSDQGLGIPAVNLYSALAARANIVKMGDDEKKGPAKVYDMAVKLGEKKAKESGNKIFVKGFISGCHIALGAMLAVSFGVFKGRALDIGLQKILLGMFGLPLALLMTVVAGGQLVTSNFAFLGAAFFEGKTTLGKCWSNWFTVIAGNFFGSILIAWLAYEANLGFGDAARRLAMDKIHPTFGTLVAKGILCNWLVCMAMWMAASAKDVVSQAVAIFLPVSGFVALGFQHSVANMFLISFGMYYGADVDTGEMFFKNLIPVALGNLIGGVWGVAYLYKLAFGAGKKKKKED